MQHTEFVETLGIAAELTGVGLIVGGLALAALRYTRQPGSTRYVRLRHDMGRAILLGLEVLVAADIIRTVAFAPTMESVFVLGVIVAIRTFLSWSLARKLDGRWPWQRQSAVAPHP